MCPSEFCCAAGPFGPNPSMKQAPMEGQEGRRKLDFAFVTEEVFSKDKVPEQPATSQLRFVARQWAKSQDVTLAGFSSPRFLANERWCTQSFFPA